MTETLPAIALYAGVAAVALVAAAGGYLFYRNRAENGDAAASGTDPAALDLPGQGAAGLTRFASMASKTDARGTYQIVANAMQQTRFDDRTPVAPGLTPDQRRLSELAEAAITLDNRAFEATVRYLAEREKHVFQALHDLANAQTKPDFAPEPMREQFRPAQDMPVVSRPAPVPMPAEPLEAPVTASAPAEDMGLTHVEETNVILQPDLTAAAAGEAAEFAQAQVKAVSEEPEADVMSSPEAMFATALRSPPLTDTQSEPVQFIEAASPQEISSEPVVAKQTEDERPALQFEALQAPDGGLQEEPVEAAAEMLAPTTDVADEVSEAMIEPDIAAAIVEPKAHDLAFVLRDAPTMPAPQFNLRTPDHLIPMPGRPEAPATPAPAPAPQAVAATPTPAAPASAAPSRPDLSQDEGQAKFNSRLQRALSRPSPAFDPTPAQKAKVSDQEYRPFMSVQNILEWLPANGDPDLWHLLVAGLDYDLPATLDIVHWIVQQPDCDRATAALALELINIDALMPYENLEECPELQRKSWQIAETICQRASAGQYMRSEFNLRSVSYVDDPADFLETLKRYAVELLARGATVPWPLPLDLLSSPFKGRAATSALYRVEDDTLYIAVENKTAA